MYAGYYGAGYGTGYVTPQVQGATPQPAAVAAAEPEIGNAAQISVSGCTHASVGPIVRGNYSVAGSNHNKPAYRKEQKVSGLDVMLYYWDERDGVEFSGWWFGPKIGGDQVWAYQPTRATGTPPRTGWKVPYDGAVDPTLVLAPRGVAAQQEAWKQQQEVRQQQLMAQKMQQAEEQKKRLDEARQRAEDNKKKLEEMTKKRVEDEKRRQEEIKKRSEEQRAVLAIRQVLMKMKAANLENFDLIHEEVAKVMEKELDNCGTMKTLIQSEHDKGWEQVKLRMEQLQAAKVKIQEQKRIAKEKAEIFVKEMDEAVSTAEAAASVLKEAAESLTAPGAEKRKLEQVKDIITSVDTATKEANDAYEVCTELVRKIGNAFKVADPEMKELKDQHSVLMQRMAAVSMDKDTVIKTSIKQKDEAFKRAAAKAKLDKQTALFTKYDANKDGVLDKAEIAAFAKKEYGFKVPDAAMASLLKVLTEAGAKGVKKDKFHRLRTFVGVARERAKDLVRRKAREAREKEIEEMKESFKTKLAEMETRLTEADESVKKVEEAAKPLHLQGKDMKAVAMLQHASDLEAQVQEARAPLETLKADIAGCREGAEEEITFWLTAQVRALEFKFSRLEPRLQLASATCTRFREAAKAKEKSELQAVESRARAVLRHHQKVKDLSAEGLADAMDADGDSVSQEAFVKFFETCEQEPAPEAQNGHEETALVAEDLTRLYTHWAEGSDGTVQKETLMSRVRRYMKVMKTAALTDCKSIKDSKSVRRLLEGEVVEALGPEQKEDEVDLMRLRVKAMSDGAEGWVTISGNQGTVFLKEGGNVFKVVKETILTEGFSLDDAGSKEPRKLRLGELVEVRTWMSKDEKSGLMRMKCKAVSDGAVGWATVVGNAGTVFLEVN